MRKTSIGRTPESNVAGIHGAAVQAASLAAIAVALLLVPGTAKGQDESMPTTNDGQRVIAAQIAGLPLSSLASWVGPDFRECVRLDSFVSIGTESLESLGISYYVMKFQMTVSYLDDCYWKFSPGELETGISYRRQDEAPSDPDDLLASLGIPTGAGGPLYSHVAEEGTQAVLSGEIIFQQSGDGLSGDGWRVAGIRDSAFALKESATESPDDGSSGP